MASLVQKRTTGNFIFAKLKVCAYYGLHWEVRSKARVECNAYYRIEKMELSSIQRHGNTEIYTVRLLPIPIPLIFPFYCPLPLFTNTFELLITNFTKVPRLNEI